MRRRNAPLVAVRIDHRDWQRAVPAPVRLCRRAVEAALAATPSHGRVEVGVVLADDAFVRGLNKRWRGKDRPTNVLSFPHDMKNVSVGAGPRPARSVRPPVMLGDIVVAFETANREAQVAGKSLPDHLAHLLVHGVLHLLGHDHEREPEAMRMERLEARILAGLAIADPYRG